MNLPRWAPRVPKLKIRQLYANDARGITDEELIDDVGFTMYARCQSIVTVTKAAIGQVTCPSCQAIIQRTRRKDELLKCGECDWQLTWGEYHRSYRKKQLVGGLAFPAFQEFIARWPGARTPRDKILLIDRLIHTLHAESDGGHAYRTAAVNVIGGDLKDVHALLDELAYGDLSTPGTRETADRWRHAMAESREFFRRRWAEREARSNPSQW